MARTFLRLAAALVCLGAVAGPAAAQQPATKTFTVADAQASAPVGVTIIVKKVTVREDATVVTLVASFDSSETNSVNLNNSNAFLALGNDRKLHLRQLEDNPDMTIRNGQSMEGNLVFPGRIPADVREVSLVFNDGADGTSTIAPGVTVKIPLVEAP